ncbi:hypothetical protein [Rhodanobacter umsongensis]
MRPHFVEYRGVPESLPRERAKQGQHGDGVRKLGLAQRALQAGDRSGVTWVVGHREHPAR